MPGPINRHIAEFEKNTLCYLIFKVIFLDLIEFLLEIHYSVLNYYFMQPEKCSLTKIL